jgi:hypothetical protein
MSKRAKASRATVAAPESELVRYVPDWDHACENCGEKPVVTGVAVEGPDKGRVVLATGMCGVCTWGEAAALDPSNW